MAAFLLGFVYLVTSNWSKNPSLSAGRAAAAGTTRSSEQILQRLAKSPTVWLVGFLLLVAATLGGTLSAVGAGPDWLTDIGLPVFVGVFAAATLAFIIGGTFLAVKNRGYGNAMSVAASSFVLGVIALIAMTARLLVDSLL